DRRVLDVGEVLGEFLVTAVEIADHGVDADDGLALEDQDRAEDTVRRRMLRPHVHHEALVTAVADFDDLPRFDVHRYFIGDGPVGMSTTASCCWRRGEALPRKVCHSGSCRTLARTAARSFRSR